MENFYSSKIHGFPNITSLSNGEFSQESVLSLIAVLGSSISLVGLVFAFITYSGCSRGMILEVKYGNGDTKSPDAALGHKDSNKNEEAKQIQNLSHLPRNILRSKKNGDKPTIRKIEEINGTTWYLYEHYKRSVLLNPAQYEIVNYPTVSGELELKTIGCFACHQVGHRRGTNGCIYPRAADAGVITCIGCGKLGARMSTCNSLWCKVMSGRKERPNCS